uniref:Bicarbonate transporter-like transmembrane domain-containing protein n=1 Tax=Romanomermis culicivorax TaxID=13658 RepID=A0A915JM36_ROMCU
MVTAAVAVPEQRVSPVVAHIMMAFCIFMGSVEKWALAIKTFFIPQPALLGVFFYMGVSCLLDQQFFQRILLFLTPVKHQPDFNYLRLIKMRRVHLFTVFQIVAFGLLCTVHYVDYIEMFFPVMLIALVAYRKLLNYLFNERELCILDDPFPPWNALKKGANDNMVIVDGMDTAFLRSFGLSSKETYIQ